PQGLDGRGRGPVGTGHRPGVAERAAERRGAPADPAPRGLPRSAPGGAGRSGRRAGQQSALHTHRRHPRADARGARPRSPGGAGRGPRRPGCVPGPGGDSFVLAQARRASCCGDRGRTGRCMLGAVRAAPHGGERRTRPPGASSNLDRETAGYSMKATTRTNTRAKAPAPVAAAKTQDTGEAMSMDEVWIQGGRKLKGQVPVSGSKNATLPILTATLLAPGIYRFTNVPALNDVSTMLELLALFGVRSKREEGHALFVDSTNSHNAEAPYDLVKKMRASIYVLGPLLARFGEARVSL